MIGDLKPGCLLEVISAIWLLEYPSGIYVQRIDPGQLILFVAADDYDEYMLWNGHMYMTYDCELGKLVYLGHIRGV